MSDLPKRTRPSGSEMRQRSRVIGFRAAPAEEAQVSLAAERAGLTVSSYLRSVAVAKPSTRAVRRPTVERAALSQILAQLGKCGSNLNQIARVLNSGGEEPGDIDAAIAEFRSACRAVMAAMGKRPAAEDAA